MAEPNAEFGERSVVSVSNVEARSEVLLVCEHASNYFPAELDGLGLTTKVKESHIAWDPGARLVAEHLSNLLDAPLVAGEVSRLVYDCNRPPEAVDSIPEKSEVFEIPGNAGLNAKEKADRVEKFYRPFERAVSETLARIGSAAVLITIHSFTPVYFGKRRVVELGILHDADSRLAGALMRLAPSRTTMNIQFNQPYGIDDGVTHTLEIHGVRNGILNVMLEIRNDLVSTPEECLEFARLLSGLLTDALGSFRANDRVRKTGT